MLVWFPVLVPLRFEPVTAPDAATEEGVMAPRVTVMAGVVVGLRTLPLTPAAVVTETEVTVPVPPPPPPVVVRLPNASRRPGESWLMFTLLTMV